MVERRVEPPEMAVELAVLDCLAQLPVLEVGQGGGAGSTFTAMTLGVEDCTIGWGRLGTTATCSKAFTLTVNSFVSFNGSLCNSISVVRSEKAVPGVDWLGAGGAN